MHESRPPLLIVDDSPEDRAVYRRYLHDAYAVHDAARGTEVLALCQVLQPACLLLDYRLPDIDGLALLGCVRTQYAAPVLPVVLLTGRGSETVAVAALKQGAQDYLVKDGLHPDALRRAVATAIEMARLQRAHLEAQAEQRRLEQELLRAQKLEAVGVLAGGIAHDFNNLLTGILGHISLAKQVAGPAGSLLTYLTAAEQACQRATTLTHQLLTFAKGGAPIRQPMALPDLLREATAFAVRGTPVRADLAVAPALWPVNADAGQLHQVLHNVVLNAAQALPAGGTVQVRADNVLHRGGAGPPLPAGRYVTVTVRDHGGGIPADVLPHIFDPYFTTKPAGQGLGLATAYAIVTKHDGALVVDSTVEVGTTVTMYLPASQGVPAPPPAHAPPPLGGNGRVLVLDDDPAIHALLRAMLTTLGYTVDCVRDGAAALALYEHARAAGQPFAVVLLDLTLPGGVGGRETLEQLRARDPQVKALVSSSYATEAVMADSARYGFRGVLQKPYTLHSLQEALRQALA